MSFKRLVNNVLSLLLVVVCLSNCTDYLLYVSPGNFYQKSILPVELVSIPDTTAPVEMDIYTPTWSARYPVVVFQHGFGGSIKAYETIAEHLASHGFVVILPQMYGPGFQDAPTAEEEAVLGLAVLTWIEDNLNDFIPVQADTDLLGLAGHSRGGQVAYRLALKLPEQVKALAGVDPVDATEMSNDTQIVTGPLTFDIPTYILGAGLGPVPVEEGVFKIPCAPEEAGYKHFFENNPSPSWLVVATTHGHADMIDEEDFEEFCPGGPDRDGMRSLTAGTLAAFFSGILQNKRKALRVLENVNIAPVHVEVTDK
jgi:pimeloyl-ACP methyl ester carboxylesterase